jgi:hypothetical protein
MDILYRPEDCGKEVINSRGNKSIIRKYHLTDKEIDRNRQRWLDDIVGVDKKIIKLAGNHFFNPYRKGIYYYQIKSLFLLGSNKWHSLSSIVNKLTEIMSEIEVKRGSVNMTFWELFKERAYQADKNKSKSYIGKIQENFVFFQRLSQLHPYGYKLRQVLSAVDIKREDKRGFPNGMYSYRLSTYDNVEDSLPIRDFVNFEFPMHEHKYVSYKFIGTVITKDKTVRKGVLL